MYTACGCGSWVRIAACGSFRSGIEFSRKPQATASHRGHISIRYLNYVQVADKTTRRQQLADKTRRQMTSTYVCFYFIKYSELGAMAMSSVV